jgi:catechol 2,3-dioxygenase-like lactoylglutathione lyase family enzyme
MQRAGTKDPLLITGTDFIIQPVRDYEKAAKFYGDTLGLEFSKRWGSMPAGEFETGSLTIALVEPEAFGMRPGPSAGAIALHVADVEAARADLERQGVEFKGATIDSGVCLQAIFEDPDGNMLILHNRYAPQLTQSERVAPS